MLNHILAIICKDENNNDDDDDHDGYDRKMLKKWPACACL
jgi:hypothetical protein